MSSAVGRREQIAVIAVAFNLPIAVGALRPVLCGRLTLPALMVLLTPLVADVAASWDRFVLGQG